MIVFLEKNRILKGLIFVAEIKDFKGLFYNSDIVGDISAVIAPHCHAAEEETIKRFYSSHPFNVVRLEYPSVNSENIGEKYTGAADALGKWLETGILKTDIESCIYIYEQEYVFEKQAHKIRGLICCVKIGDKDIISGETSNHEIYDAFKSDRYNLMRATEAEFSGIYSLYKDEDNAVSKLLETNSVPDLEFEDDFGIIHRIWREHNKDKINAIKESFKDKKLVIADGHIRYETAALYREKMKNEVVEYSGKENYNYVMMNLMPVNIQEPTALAVHRIIKNKQKFDENSLIEMISSVFNVDKSYIREYDAEKIEARLSAEKEKRAIGMFTGSDYYYVLTPKEDFPYYAADSEMLQNEILAKIFGINNENIKKYIDYTTSIEEAERAVREENAQYAFYLSPMSFERMYEICESGFNMPKHTLSLYPKLMMGIVMNKFDEQEG